MTLLYSGKTKHSRYYPVKHSFEYPIVFVGIDLKSVTDLKVFNINWFLSVRASDYLNGKDATFGDLLNSLKNLNKEDLDLEATLITIPRFFGYAFNPVSIFLSKDSNSILQVNNTFGETHLYHLNSENKIPSRKGYSSHKIKRQFHVSPFNDLSGDYEIHLKHDSKQTNVLELQITIIENNVKKLTGSLRCDIHEFTTLKLLKFLIFDPFVWFTFIRISKEAFILAYIKKLKIYSKPEPSSNTIRTIPLTAFERFCKKKVEGLLGEVKVNSNDDWVWFVLTDFNTACILTGSTHKEFIKDIPLEHVNFWWFRKYFVNRFLVPSTDKHWIKLSFSEQLYVAVNAIFLWFTYFVFDLITPWANGENPSPWYRAKKLSVKNMVK